jgi:putative acetyltransferase
VVAGGSRSQFNDVHRLLRARIGDVVMTGLTIRPEQARDQDAVRVVNEQAFGGREEADIVERLHGAQSAVVSLVAEVGTDMVGHILFSPVVVEHSNGKRLVGLAPMAVAPDHQRKGIGSRLLREGLARCRAAGIDGVVVLGHAKYYPRFGFVPAQQFGLRCEYDVPADVFMAMELTPGALVGVSGLVRYHPAFGAA